MYKLGDILEFTHLVSTDRGWVRVAAYVLVVEKIFEHYYLVRDIQNVFKKEHSYHIADHTAGFRKVGNIWESSLKAKVGCAQRKQPR